MIWPEVWLLWPFKGAATAGILGFVALALGAIAAWCGGGMGAPHRNLALQETATRRV